ncbi:hypothetical protein WJX72_011169 [[Myrmecia] bisecta]|uniref:CRAL-TRIO domain-containing protein n=1 Tax=[Myrmecia] bisecta TaxID=41462 RepID=A0AAW1QSU3_9CHLO
MPRATTPTEVKAVQDLEVELKKRGLEVPLTMQPCGDLQSTLFRFLKARKFDVDLAADMIENSMKWRQENDIDNILSKFLPDGKDAIIRRYLPAGFLGFDKAGQPVWMEHAAAIDVTSMEAEGITLEDYVFYHVRSMEYLVNVKYAEASKLAGHQVDTHCVVLDLAGLRMGQLTKDTIKMFKGLSTVYQDHYPELMTRMFLVNIPMIFSAVWRILSMFVDDRVKAKIRFLRKADLYVLHEFVERDVLPEGLGGRNPNQMLSDKLGYVPESLLAVDTEIRRRQGLGAISLPPDGFAPPGPFLSIEEEEAVAATSAPEFSPRQPQDLGAFSMPAPLSGAGRPPMASWHLAQVSVPVGVQPLSRGQSLRRSGSLGAGSHALALEEAKATIAMLSQSLSTVSRKELSMASQTPKIVETPLSSRAPPIACASHLIIDLGVSPRPAVSPFALTAAEDTPRGGLVSPETRAMEMIGQLRRTESSPGVDKLAEENPAWWSFSSGKRDRPRPSFSQRRSRRRQRKARLGEAPKHGMHSGKQSKLKGEEFDTQRISRKHRWLCFGRPGVVHDSESEDVSETEAEPASPMAHTNLAAMDDAMELAPLEKQSSLKRLSVAAAAPLARLSRQFSIKAGFSAPTPHLEERLPRVQQSKQNAAGWGDLQTVGRYASAPSVIPDGMSSQQNGVLGPPPVVTSSARKRTSHERQPALALITSGEMAAPATPLGRESAPVGYTPRLRGDACLRPAVSKKGAAN